MNDNIESILMYETPSLEELYISPVVVKGASGENEDSTTEEELSEMGEGQEET